MNPPNAMPETCIQSRGIREVEGRGVDMYVDQPRGVTDLETGIHCRGIREIEGYIYELSAEGVTDEEGN